MPAIGIGIGTCFGAAGGFRPTSIPGNVMWVAADRGITLVGGNVSARADQSGSSHDLAQGTAANQPLWVASDAALNGQPSIDYDNTNDSLLSDEAASVWKFLHDGTGCTIAMALNTAAAESGGILTTLGAVPSAGLLIDYNVNVANAVRAAAWGAGAVYRSVSLAIAAQTPMVLVYRLNSAETPIMSMRLNGTEGTLAGAGAASAADPDRTLCIGEWATAHFFNGQESEIAIWSRYLTAAEVLLIESAWTAKYL